MAVRVAEASIVFSGVTDPLRKSADDAKRILGDVDRQAARVGASARAGAADLRPQLLAGTNLKREMAAQDMRASARAQQPQELRRAGGGGLGLAGAAAVAVTTGGVSLAADALAGVADAVTGSVRGMAGLAAESVKLAGSMEQTKISFGVILGGVDKADAMIAGLKDFAARSPLTFENAAAGAKQLVAYGVAADQTLPTLRALTDVASGTGVELGRLTMAYGQVATAGRLYGTELRQFTEAGVPIIDALATALDRPKESIRGLVEDGRVGFPEVVKAFKVLTEGTGKFAGMTEKYGQSFNGQLEQLADAVQVLKTELGGALIEGLDLKGATRDMGAFADRVRAGVDDLKPGIRLAGDLARATAQLANEGAKAAAIFAEVRFANLAADIPALKALPDLVTAALKDLREFKLDPVKVTEAAIDLVDAMMPGVRELQLQAGKILGDGREFKDNLVEGVRQVREIAGEVLSLVKQIKALKDVGAVAMSNPAAAASPAGRFVLGGMLRPLTKEQLNAEAAADQLERVTTHDTVAGALGGSVTAELRARGMRPEVTDLVGGKPVPPKGLVENLKAGAVGADAWDQVKAGLMEGARARQAAGLARDAAAYKADLADPASARFAANAGLAGAALLGLGVDAEKAGAMLLRVPGGPDARIVELSAKLNKEYAAQVDPVADLRKQVADLDAARGLRQGGISADVHALAVRDALAGATKGLDLAYKPPPSAEFGSRDFARLETSAFTSGRSESVPDILRAMLAAARETVRQNTDLPGKLGAEFSKAAGPVVAMPGK